MILLALMSEFLYGRVINEFPIRNGYNEKISGRVIGWLSGGVASAIACKLAIDHYGDAVELVFCDTQAEHPDTHRFLQDFCRALGRTYKTIKSPRFDNPEQVWRHYKGLNFAHGAPCSTVLKREVRVNFQEINTDFSQVFGFDYEKKEERRAANLLGNYPEINPIFPLIAKQVSREKVFKMLEDMGVKRPVTYDHFFNNNCIGSFDKIENLKNGNGFGCIQGGIGYWQKVKKLFSWKFDYMASIEHELSNEKGEPVTICKDQRKATNGNKLFLKPHPSFPDIESIDVIKGRQPVTAFECNGFCSTSTQLELF